MLQTEFVASLLRESDPEIAVEIVTMDTSGDLQPDQSLAAVGGKGLFTRELEQALRRGDIDLCVHSLKDVPYALPEDLPLLAYSRREDPRDALVLPAGGPYAGLEALASGRRPVGCSSARRTVLLALLCPELAVEPVRGNVLTRLRKLDGGGFGALVLAAAGLRRLGLAARVTRLFSVEEMLPAAGQGILAVQGRADFDAGLLGAVDDAEGRLAALAERGVIAALGCGCSSPAAAYCRAAGPEIELRGFYQSPATGRAAHAVLRGGREDYAELARCLARRLQKEVEA